MILFHQPRAFEEVLAGNREKLRLIGQGIGVDVRIIVADLLHLPAHQFDPWADRLATQSHSRNAVNNTVGLVHQMSEFVYTHVALVRGILESLDQVRFNQDHDAVHGTGADHAQDVLAAAAITVAIKAEVRTETRRIDEDLADLIPLPAREAKDRNHRAGPHQNLRPCVNGRTDSGDHLFAQEDLQFVAKTDLFLFGQSAKEGHVPVQHGLPLDREERRQQLFTAPHLAQRKVPGLPGTASRDRHQR